MTDINTFDVNAFDVNMFDVNIYISKLTEKLRGIFGERLVYLGLQGSYLRGEASSDSDIDIMAVIDGLSLDDLKLYKQSITEIGDYDKSCGFICGKDELAVWNPLESCQLIHTTKDIIGRLSDFVPDYTRRDEVNYIKLSAGNLYHELCHRFIHTDLENSVRKLPRMVKPIFFILQNLHYIESGRFCATKQELLSELEGDDKKLFEILLNISNSSDYDFDSVFKSLLSFCRRAMDIE